MTPGAVFIFLFLQKQKDKPDHSFFVFGIAFGHKKKNYNSSQPPLKLRGGEHLP